MLRRTSVLSLILMAALALSTPISAMTNGTFAQGGSHSAALLEDGTLWATGYNTYGVLGDGTTEHRNTYAPVLEDVVYMTASLGNTAAIRSDGSLWTTGYNEYGTVGDGTTQHRSSYVKIMEDVASVSIHDLCGAAVKTDGTLWTWGDGYLGNGPMSSQLTPVQILDNVASVSMGGAHGAAVRTDGTLWTWGYNLFGQLGDGTYEDRLTPVPVLDRVASISVGYDFTAAIRTDGSLWVWGYNGDGQLGQEPTWEYSDSATPVKVMDDVAAVGTGLCHLIALKTDGTVWTWGSDKDGQLGEAPRDYTFFIPENNEYPFLSTPTQIMDGVVAISAGADSCAALKADGSLFNWGYNEYGGLGDGTTKSRATPRQVLTGVRVPPLPVATPSTCPVLVDGKPVDFDAYLLSDETGGTNYLKLRDVANVLNGTSAQFNVEWQDGIRITTSAPYTSANGSEMSVPFSGNRLYAKTGSSLSVDGKETAMDAITLTDSDGNGYTYFKLRDLGEALGFSVDWDAKSGAVIIDTPN